MNRVLCSHLKVNLNNEVSSLNCSGTFHRLAAIVCLVAFAAIATLASAIYLGLLATPPTWAIIAGLGIGFLSMKGIDIWKQGSARFQEAESLQKIVDKERELEREEIGQWLLARNIVINPEAMPHLREKRPDAPLKALIPLIARFLLEEEAAAALKQRAQENLGRVRDQQNPELQREHFFEGMKAYDTAAKTKFSCAQLLQNIQEPTTEFLIQKDELGNIRLLKREELGEIPTEVGRHRPVSFDNRVIEHVQVPGLLPSQPHNFFQPEGRPPITLEVLYDLPIQNLRGWIFG
jgi:hypothetical protein